MPMTTPLTPFTRTFSGLYVATDGTRRYHLRCVRRRWHLTIYECVASRRILRRGPLVDRCGPFSIREYACVVARRYSQLGDDHDPADHGGRDRMAEALYRTGINHGGASPSREQ